MPRSKKKETKQKSIAIQTDNADSIIEIIHLQEQLKLLRLENDTLKKHVNGNILSVTDFSDTSKLAVVESPQRVNTIRKENSQVLKSASKSKLCTCKGKCSSKICGCVKNERKCGPMCKCDNEICQNQELENKENMGNAQNEIAQNEIAHDIQKLEDETLKDITQPKHLFSPEGGENVAHLSNIEFEDSNCVLWIEKKGDFNTQRKLTYNSDEELQNENKSKIRNDVIEKRNRDRKEHKAIADKGHVTISKRNIKMKTEENITIGINENNAQEPSENGVKIIQVSPLCEDANKTSMLEADTSFDPMKPKRQLPRTPPHGNIEYEPEDVPIILQTSPEKTEQNVDIIPDELNQENVDLDKLCIELISCDRCRRKFYPWRIVVHKSACLGL